MYLQRGDTYHVGTLIEVSPRHRFYCITNCHNQFPYLLVHTHNIYSEMENGVDNKTSEEAKYCFILNRSYQKSIHPYMTISKSRDTA